MQSQIQDFPKEGAPFVLSAKSTRFSGGGGWWQTFSVISEGRRDSVGGGGSSRIVQ